MNRPPGLIRPHLGKITLLARVVDAALIVLALYVSCAAYGAAWGLRHVLAAPAAVLVYSLVAEVTGLYRMPRGTALRKELYRLWATWVAVVSVLLLGAFFAKVSESFSRVVTLIWVLSAPVLLALWRSLLRVVLGQLRHHGRNTRSVAIAGMSPNGERLAREILDAPWSGLRLRGFYDDRLQADRRHAVDETLGPARGGFSALIRDVHENLVDIVYVALPLAAEARIQWLVRELADTTASVHVVADLFVSDLLRSHWSTVGQIPVLSVFRSPFYGVDGWLKRIEDLVLGAMILCIVAVPMLVIAIGVKATSPGPVLFRQRRYGLDGREFIVWKFRTMTTCDDGNVVKQATKNDPRVTRFGAFLRSTSLDELPQFLQVLRGDMSIVGPRPHAVVHNEFYRKRITGYMLRHKVKPGITGWAQVNGWRGETDSVYKMRKRIEHDLAYIRNWGLLLDLKIIALTVFGSKTRRNAY